MNTNGEDSHTHTHTHTHTPIINFDIPIFSKLYEFYKLLYQYLKLFPKRDRYSLGQKIDTLTLEILQLTIQAGTSVKEKKLPYLDKAVVSVNLLKILIRLAKDIEALELKKYIHLQELLQEIGRMLGGWKRKFSSP